MSFFFCTFAPDFCIVCIMRLREGKIIVVFMMLVLTSVGARAQAQPYLCEVGLQAGCSYYVGEAASHIFMHPREAYGLQFRYKFTKRWALQVKGQTQRITGHEYEYVTGRGPVRQDAMWQDLLINIDVMAEFNFFRFGSANKYDKRIRPYTPYIFMGIGTGVYGMEGYTGGGAFNKVMAYFPFGLGFKWKFSDRCGLNIAWQHNIFFADNLENRDHPENESLDNRYHLNGWNWMNCDLTGTFTAGIVFEFGHAKKPCRICNTD